MLHELKRYEWEIIILYKLRQEDKGEFYHNEHSILTSGREDAGHQDGIALVLKPKTSQALITFNLISPHMLMVKFRIKSSAVTIIQVYEPNSAAPKEEIDKFYNDPQKTIQKVSTQNALLVMRDFKWKVGSNWNSKAEAIGRFRLDEENERGENFCLGNNLVITKHAISCGERRIEL